MKAIKISSIALLSVLFIWFAMPQLSARHHSRTSFSFNLNMDPRPRYVEYGYAYPVAPAYTVVQPYGYPTYYAPQTVIVERPYAERVYVYPRASYSYWGY